MNPGELLEPDLTRRAKFVGTDYCLSTDERAEIDTREVLRASRTQTRVRDVARRRLDGTKQIVASQSPILVTAERSTPRPWHYLRPRVSVNPPPIRSRTMIAT
jgi:hypothetical protein